jgi:U4/U6 small nuclear ribonucleoprotein PRP3
VCFIINFFFFFSFFNHLIYLSNKQFVEKGMYEKAADFTRLTHKFGEVEAIRIRKREDRERQRAEHTEALEAAVAGQTKTKPDFEQIVQEFPLDDGIEWWDKPFIKEGKSLADCPIDEKMDGESVGKLWENFLNTDKITKYVEHPYLEEPPMEAPPPPPPPVKLTKKEQKKLRHQRRVAREQEKQEMMRQGVLEPPKPKVKISNMMRVLTEEAVMDPTMIEKKVREEMEERQQAHDDRNLARKLTPAEKREKKIRKLLRDVTSEAGEVFTHVYRIENMRNVKNKFKVDVNAQENHLTGIGIITDTFSIVIVEGTNKGLKRYEKLMMHRIDWTLTNDDYTDEEIERAENNKITLVWKGSGPQRKMKRFRFETLRTEAAARKYLEGDYNCANYFDAAQSAIKYEGDDEEEEDNEEE